MIRSKQGVLGLCAMALGVIAVSATSAQAAFSWLVLDSSKSVATEVVLTGEGGTNLLAALTGEPDSADLSLLTELNGLEIAVTCTNFTLLNFSLEAHGKLSTGGRTIFTGCDAYKGGILGTNLGCVVKSPGAPDGTIETNELKGELALHAGAEVVVKILALGTDIATLRFEECELTEVNPLRGVIYINDGLAQATTHATRHLIEQHALTRIYLGSHNEKKLSKTKFDGSAWVELTGTHDNLDWSAMDM